MKNDHDILHYWAENLKEASTSHALVKNGAYGISHAVAYDQDTLTLEQIKEMHDAWVLENEKGAHSTPIDIPTTEEEKKRSRWDEVIINNPETGTLSKRDIYRYYSSPEVKNTIFNQIKNKPLLVRQAMDTTESWLKRSPGVRKNFGNVNDPEDLQYYIERRHVEFHPTFEELTDKIVVDIDPGKSVGLEDTKKVVDYTRKFLENQPEIEDTEIQFSGNRGFYVWGYLKNKQNINLLREKLNRLLSQISEMNGVAVTLKQNPENHVVRLDLSPMKNLGSVKAEGSLDYRTGFISKKISVNRLSGFNPKRDASVVKEKLKPVYSFKDETLV